MCVVNPRPDTVLLSYTCLEAELWTHRVHMDQRSQDASVEPQWFATSWVFSCGEVHMSRPCNRASRFLGHLLGTMISCRTIWKGLPMSTNDSWTCRLQCRTFSRFGCFLCIARQPGRTVCCALCAPTVCGEVAETHDRAVGRVHVAEHSEPSRPVDTGHGTLPLSLGGLCLRSAIRTSPSALWASRADSLPMINARHPAVADTIIRELDGHPVTPCQRGASRSARDLLGVGEFEPPSWISLVNGPARTCANQRTMNLAGSVKGGSMGQHPELNGC